jgi:hypothetical protein
MKLHNLLLWFDNALTSLQVFPISGMSSPIVLLQVFLGRPYYYVLQTHNNKRPHERGYASKLYSLAEVQHFSTAIFEAPNNDHIG